MTEVIQSMDRVYLIVETPNAMLLARRANPCAGRNCYCSRTAATRSARDAEWMMMHETMNGNGGNYTVEVSIVSRDDW